MYLTRRGTHLLYKTGNFCQELENLQVSTTNSESISSKTPNFLFLSFFFFPIFYNRNTVFLIRHGNKNQPSSWENSITRHNGSCRALLFYNVPNSILMSVFIQVTRILSAWGKGPNSHWKIGRDEYIFFARKTLGHGFIQSNSKGLTSLPTAGCQVPLEKPCVIFSKCLGMCQIPKVSPEAQDAYV